MLIYFYVENMNQVDLSYQISMADTFPADITSRLLYIEHRNSIFKPWLRMADRLKWNIPRQSIFDEAPALLKRNFLNNHGKSNYAIDVIRHFFQRHLFDNKTILLQFNDASSTGAQIARVCRALGLPRVLVQDGFLNFVSKTNRIHLSDQNYHWGASQPEFAAVWGHALRDAVLQRHHNTPSTVRITGRVGRSADMPCRIEHASSLSEPVRVLWIDQAILDQKKADRDKWLSEFCDMANCLAAFDTTVRLHPSTSDANVGALREAIKNTSIDLSKPDTPTLSADQFENCDVVFTYYSTAFLDAIRAQKPCVIFSTESLDIELPVIDHPLLQYCRSVIDIPDAIRRAASLTLSCQIPQEFSRYLSSGDGASNVAKLISELRNSLSLERKKQERVFTEILLEHDPEYLYSIKRLHGSRILVIGCSFDNYTGVGVPIKHFANFADHLDLEFFLVMKDNANLMHRVEESDIIVFNGIGTAASMPGEQIAAIAAHAKSKRKTIIVYWHETNYVFQRLKKTNPAQLQIFMNHIVSEATNLVISFSQGDWVSKIGGKNIRTVYHTIGAYLPSPRLPDKERPIILMAGTRQKRKGLDLFSQVADLAVCHKKPWRFIWLGGYSTLSEGCYQSSAVEYIGHVSSDEVRDWLSRTSVFFLSSIDEPLGLVVGEALSSGVPCVMSTTVGYSEIIQWIGAGECFTFYTPKSAFIVLEKVLNNLNQYSIDQTAVENLIGLKPFCRRLTIVLGDSLISAKPPAKSPAKSPYGFFRRTVYGMGNALLPKFISKPAYRLLKKMHFFNV